MSTQKNCPHCGKSLTEEPEEAIIITEKEEVAKSTAMEENEEDRLVTSITKKVVVEVMQTIRPLLEKLQELGKEQSAPEMAASNPNSQQSQEQLLQSLQAKATEQLKLREQKLSIRMKKLQSRVAKHR